MMDTQNSSSQVIEEIRNEEVGLDFDLNWFKKIELLDRSSWTLDTYIKAGQMAVATKIYTQWIIGMLASEVMNSWGHDEEYAKFLNIATSSLQTYRFVYKKFTSVDNSFSPLQYHEIVPYGVLQICARTEDPVKFLGKLADNNIFTIKGAYRYLRETEETVVAEVLPEVVEVINDKPAFSLELNAVNGKWLLNIPEDSFDRIDWSAVRESLINYLTKE